MFTDKNLLPIHDLASYVDEKGTKYPGNFPKTKISGLFKVKEVPPPTDSNLVVTGFTINSKYEQVWTTREKTEQEIIDGINIAHSELVLAAKTKLEWTDVVALRCVKAGVPFTTPWAEYVVALREIAKGDVSTLPAPPMDESGNIAYPLGS